MIPFSQRTYYPTIRGIAKTNATVEVRQNGYLIYSTSVPPGQFEIGREQIADLGVGVGVLDVSIYEKMGRSKTIQCHIQLLYYLCLMDILNIV